MGGRKSAVENLDGENEMKKTFWKGRRVFITGISGFVGSNLAEALLSEGAFIVGLVRDDSKKEYFDHLKIRKKITVVRGDLRSLPFLQKTLRKHKIEIVYHLAAQAIVSMANKDPLPTFEANIQGTWNLLEACRGLKSLKAIIAASSDKAYGSSKVLPYTEKHPLEPEYPYDVSKACSDLIARSYARTFDLPVVTTRFANIYGPGDINFSRIVPDTLQSVLKGKNPIIRSDGTPERDYLYVGDVADLYMLLAVKINKTKGQIFNAGHNKPVSVLKMVQTVLKVSGRKNLKPEIIGKGSLHGEIDRQWMDGGKVRRMLGWKPKTNLEQGLRKTLAWYRDWLKN